MDTNEEQELKEQRRRRNRINRIKTGIVLSILIWMVASMVAIVILSVQVVRLHHELERFSTVQGNVATNQNISDTQAERETQENRKTVENGVNDPENLAGEKDTHKVYLTFDGGPDANTEKLLDILKKYGVKASFFVSGNSNEKMKPVYRRIVKEGHTLGMHSYTNRYSEVYASEEAFTKDLNRLCDYLEQVTGQESVYYRFPGGSCNEISNVPMEDFARILNERNITYFDWNVPAGDTGEGYTVEDIVENVTTGVARYKTSVVLLHDGNDKSTTVEALGPLIEALEKMGAEILPIDENTQVIQYVKADRIGAQ